MKPIVKYIKGAQRELKKVTWPSRKEATKLTFAVIVYTLAFVIFLALVDYGLGIVFENIIL